MAAYQANCGKHHRLGGLPWYWPGYQNALCLGYLQISLAEPGCPQSSMLHPQREFSPLENCLSRQECLSLGHSGCKFCCFAHRARWSKSQFGEGRGTKKLRFTFPPWIPWEHPPTCSAYLWGPGIAHRKAVLFSFVLEINLLLNFFKYLLLCGGGRKKCFPLSSLPRGGNIPVRWLVQKGA